MDLPFESGPAEGATADSALPRSTSSAHATALQPEGPIASENASTAEPIASLDSLASLRELVLPERLDPALHDGALRIVARVSNELRQPLLDELAGHLGMPRKTIDNPLGWLNKLAQRALEGSLFLTMAPAVAATRERRARAAVRAARVAPEPAPAVFRDAVAMAKLEQARAKLRETKRSILAGKRAPADSRGNETSAQLSTHASDAFETGRETSCLSARAACGETACPSEEGQGADLGNSRDCT